MDLSAPRGPDGPPPVSRDATAPQFPANGGEMGALIRHTDWSRTPIGPVEGWSQALRMMVSFLLANRFPLLLWWGPDYVQIYNDAYRSVPGTKHPRSLGQRGSECWPEIWHILAPLIDTPFNGGPATWIEDLPLEVNRHGFVEETHFTVAYSPVPDETAPRGIGGVLATVHEITEKVIGERRVVILRDLAARAADAKSAEEACRIAAGVLSHHAKDVPFALFYLIDSERREARLAGAAGVSFGHAASTIPLDATGAPSAWPLAETIARQEVITVDGLAARLGDVPPGPWSDPPHSAVVIPVRATKVQELAGLIVAGVSPRLRLDDRYRSFFELMATQIAASIANARAYEEERKRAEALAELDRAKTAFFSNISHELRTPLTLLLGPLEEMLASPPGALPERREDLALAHRNGLRLLRLVNTLLDFSRVEAGRVQAVFQPTELAALTRELAASFQSACEAAGLDLAIAAEPLPQPVFVDREMWEKIVLNLVSNAYKFTLAGRIVVALRAEGDHAVLRVADTGTGIPEAELPFIFARFHRVEGARGRTHEGTGIGLALVQELVKLHHGEVTVESALGRGTAFTVRIPFGAAHLPAERIGGARAASTATHAEAFVSEALRWLPDGVLAEPENSAPPLQPAGDRPRVLLADDSADMRDYLLRLLEPHYDVTAVADGEQALAAARHARPDIVLADVMMPRLDGFGLLRRLRADTDLRDMPVVVVSARAGEEATADGMRGGADDYLVKPFSARELLARVAAHLKLARIRRAAGEALRHRTEQFRTLVDCAPVGVVLIDADYRILELNPVARRYFGGLAVHALGRDLREVVAAAWQQSDADQILDTFRHTLETGETVAIAEWSAMRADRDATECYEWKLDRIVLPDGRHGLVCYFRDISARMAADSTRQLLLKELTHRVKNTLATVQAIAHQTLRRTKEPADFAARFAGRIQSLARVHSLLTDSSWEGADLRQLIRDQLVGGAVDEARLTAWGPAVRLAPQMTVHLALMLHELATNCVKYGALSTPSGWVTVNWSLKEGELHLRWTERGGPAVAAPFARGFGTTLIQQSAKGEGGAARMTCEPEGITWEIVLPLPRASALESVAARDAGRLAPAQAADAAPAAALAGRRFLVVEDEPLIALDLADMLQRAGAHVLGPVGTEREALALIEQERFDYALLDANLHGRAVDAVAAALARRNVPFVFVTGYGDFGAHTASPQVPVLAKPVGERQLIEALLRIPRRTAGVARLIPG